MGRLIIIIIINRFLLILVFKEFSLLTSFL